MASNPNNSRDTPATPASGLESQAAIRRPRAKGRLSQDITLGGAGLILVCLRLLQFAQDSAKDIGDVFWFISSIGILASFVGLVMCVICLVNGSGRTYGLFGILIYAVLALIFVVL